MGMHLRARYDWNKTGDPRVALATRIGGAFIAIAAALSWPLFLFLAVTRDWTVIFAPLLITAGAVVQRAGMRKVYGVPAEPEPVPEPEPRVPRDLDRPYPRPKGSRRKLDKTCPVCGTGDGTGSLGGKVLGWPAHASCAEWLGENWRPARPAPPPFSPDKQLIGYIEQGQKPADPGPIAVGRTNTVHYAGGTAITVSAWSAGGGGSTSGDVMAWLANGLISTDEARLRLNAEMLGAYGVPGPDLGESDAWKREAERQARKKAAPVFPEYCTCGKEFTGTAEQNRRALDTHHASGECPHSAKGRADGRPKPNFAPNNPTGPIAPDTRP
jgi:hypothetical protein